MAKKKKKAKKKTDKRTTKIKTDKEIRLKDIPEDAEFVEQDGTYYVKCPIPGSNRKVWQVPVRRGLGQDDHAKKFCQKFL